MIKKLSLFALVLGLSAILFSCSDDEKGPSSSFTFESKTYPLSKGYRSEFGEVVAGVYGHEVVLYSKEITASNINSNFDFIDFSVYSSSETSLPDGTYNFESSLGALTFDFSSVNIGFNFSSGTGDSYDVTAGTIIVSNSGKKFVFDLTVDGGKKVTGTFNGSLIVD